MVDISTGWQFPTTAVMAQERMVGILILRYVTCSRNRTFVFLLVINLI